MKNTRRMGPPRTARSLAGALGATTLSAFDGLLVRRELSLELERGPPLCGPRVWWAMQNTDFAEPRPIAAVIGSARATAAEQDLARELGRCLVDKGFRVATGGMGGVMKAAALGARAAERYRPGDTIAVLPTYEMGDQHESDVVVRTGMQHARNVVLVATSTVVLAIGGRAGTLSEIAIAWELRRPIICVGQALGWALRVAGQPIDDRHDTVVHGPMSPMEASLLAERLVRSGAGPTPTFA